MDLLGKNTKRLTNRRRVRGRGNRRTEVVPVIQKANLPVPILGCEPRVFDSGLIEQDPERTGIRISREERDLISEQSRKMRQSLPTLKIESTSYTVFAHDDLKKAAVFEVKNTNDEGLYSVNDPRSGVVDKGLCPTCHLDNLECPGHFGIINLNEPILHPSFRREVIHVLMSVCNSCGGLLLPADQAEDQGILALSGTKRLKAISKLSAKLPCRRSKQLVAEGIEACLPNPTYKPAKIKDTGKIFYTRDPKSKDKDIERTTQEIQNILESIPEEDAQVLGFSNKSHPKRFVLQSIPVIPLCARAPVIQDGQIMGDELTTMYKDIVRHNLALVDPDIQEVEYLKALAGITFSIEHLIDNSDKRYRQGKKKPYKAIRERVQGKEGIIRSMMMGKRVNFSARTVLSPDPNLKFGQVRVPRIMAPYLTQHEKVTPENIGRLQLLFYRGKVTHLTPGSGRKAGVRLAVDDRLRKRHRLRFGDELDRWLQDGDYVIFNRQPTLHKEGFMGYQVVLGDPMTFGLHLGYTSQHNADFDGDEGAVHAPQSVDAVKEVASLMHVTCNLMSAQKNKNAAGVVYDALVGAYLLTQPDTRVDEDVRNDILMFLENGEAVPTLFERGEKYHLPPNSGRLIFSALFPVDFYYRKKDVLIRDGILVAGTITKDHIGTTGGSIIQALYKDYGQNRTVDFLTDVYRMTGKYLDSHGFSVGIDDCFLIGDDPDKTIQYEIQRARMLVKSMGSKLEDPLEEERRENQIRAYLNTAKGMGTRISEKNLAPDNSFNIMAKSGAKGSTFNIAQITGILGQQYVKGQRMPEVLKGKTRASPYFPENSLDPSARGFVTNSFLTGLSPAEMLFHMAGGREGLTDTAIKTGDTGYMHHRISKALESTKVVSDGSVRNEFGNIFQFSYGEDGFNSAYLEGVSTKNGSFASFINIKRLAGRINAKYGYTTPGEPQPEFPEPEIKKVEETFVKPYGGAPLPDIPILGVTIKVGDKVTTVNGEGVIEQIDGERVLVTYENGSYWTKIEKLEKK
jgi:DNA-directed RNA polymerase beta' subunit